MEIEQIKKKSVTPIKKQDFPQLQCSEHTSPVIFVNSNASESQKMFMCAKCVQSSLSQLQQDSKNIMIYEDFVNFISLSPAQQQGASAEDEQESHQLLNSQKKNLNEFKQLIEEEKLKVSQTMSKLQDLYQEKCSELVDTLQQEFTQQNQHFIQNYGKFENAVQADFEKEAELPKYNEIVHNISGMQSAQQKEDYLSVIYKKKLAWSKASQNIQQFNKRNEVFYRELVQSQITNSPKFGNMAQLIQTWITGLDKLIDQVKDTAGVFDNLYKVSCNRVPLEIKSIAELSLVTNQMIKNDTLFILNFQGTKLSKEETVVVAQTISHLTNIVNLQFNLEESQMSADQVKELALAFKNLTHLTFFEFLAFGSKFGDASCNELAIGLSEIATQLKCVKLNLGFNNVGNSGVQILSESISKMANLTSLVFDMKNNNIKAQGATAFGENLEKIANQLCEISLDFSGYSVKHNEVKSAGGIAILRALKKCVNCIEISLDLGHNDLSDSFMNEFSMTFTRGVHLKLKSLNLALNNNDFNYKGIKKLSSCLGKSALNSLNLNLNSIKFKQEGASEIVLGLRKMFNLEKLILNIRNVDLKKNQISQLKADLQKEKTGKEFVTLEFLA